MNDYTPPARRRVFRVGLKVSFRSWRSSVSIFLPPRRDTTKIWLSSATDFCFPSFILLLFPRHARYACGGSYFFSSGSDTSEYRPCSVSTNPYAQLVSSQVSKNVTHSNGIPLSSSSPMTRPGALRPIISSWGLRAPRILTFSRRTETFRTSSSSGYATMSLRDVYTRRTSISGSRVRSSSNSLVDRYTRFVHPPPSPKAIAKNPRRNGFPMCTCSCLHPRLRQIKPFEPDPGIFAHGD